MKLSNYCKLVIFVKNEYGTIQLGFTSKAGSHPLVPSHPPSCHAWVIPRNGCVHLPQSI